jgi:hypothetical protein
LLVIEAAIPPPDDAIECAKGDLLSGGDGLDLSATAEARFTLSGRSGWRRRIFVGILQRQLKIISISRERCDDRHRTT